MEIKNKIEKTAYDSRCLEPLPEDRKSMQTKIIDYTENFLNNLPDHSKMPTFYISKKKGGEIMNFPIGEPHPLEQLIDLAGRTVDSEGLNPASGGHLGYIPGGGIYTSSLADYWAAITNRYAGMFYANPGAVRVENHLINWMKMLIGYPKEALGNLASGGSIANLIAVVTAREAMNLKPPDYDKAVIYLSPQTHHCLHKALKIAGLKGAIWRKVPLDDLSRMQADKLQDFITEDKKQGLIPWLVIASAGTTDTGAIDPLDDIAAIANRQNLWFHVDAAYGGFFMLLDEYKEKLKAIAKADSVVMDPHKGLFLPYGIGVVLIKNGMKLKETFSFTASYMQDTQAHVDEVSPAEVSPELTKHFRGLRMWLPLMHHGVVPFKAALEEKILLARYFYEEIKKLERFETGPYPQMSVVIFRYIPEAGDANEFNKALVRLIHEDGRLFISSTVINENFSLRLAVLSFRTHLQTIDLMLEIIKEKVILIKKAPEEAGLSNKTNNMKRF